MIGADVHSPRQVHILLCKDEEDLMTSLLYARELNLRPWGDRIALFGVDRGREGTSLARDSELWPSERRSLGELGAKVEAALSAREVLGSSVCMVPASDPARGLAAAYALYTKRHLVVLEDGENYQAVMDGLPSDEPSVLVCTARYLRQESIEGALDGLLPQEHRATIPVIGVISGEDVTAIADWMARSFSREAPQERCATVYWDGDEASPGDFGDNGPTVVGVSQKSVKADELCAPGPFAIFSGHGRDYCAMSGHLCTRSPEAEGESCAPGIACMSAEWPRIPARELRADVVVLACCFTAGFQSGLRSLNVALSMLGGGATAVLSPYRNFTYCSPVLWFLWEAASHGAPIGWICSEANTILNCFLGGSPRFLLFGEPNAHVFAPNASESDPLEGWPKAVSEKTPQGWILHVEPHAEGRKIYHCRDNELASEVRRGLVHVKDLMADGEDAGRSPTIVQGTNGAWLVFDRAPSASTRLVLSSAPPFRGGSLELVNALLYGLLREYEASALEPSGALAKLREGLCLHATSIRTTLVMPVAGAHEYDGFGLVEQGLLQLGREASEQFLAKLSAAIETHGWLFRYYQTTSGMCFQPQEYSSEVCMGCGATAVWKKEYDAGAYPSHRRVIVECQHCGPLADTPVEQAPCIVEAPPELKLEGQSVVQVCGLNPHGHESLVSATVNFGPRLTRAEFTVDPPVQTQLVAAGGWFALEFRVSLGAARPHVYNLKAALLINGVPVFCNKRLVVRSTHWE